MLGSAEADFAIDAVTRACDTVRQVQAEMVTPALTKGDRSPVTVGDFAAQAIVARLLNDTFPRDALVGEESAAALRAAGGADTLAQVVHFVARSFSDATDESVCQWIDRGDQTPDQRYWTLDPIDGTKGFLRGDQYVVALALIEGGAPVLGIVGCPNLSVRGEPAGSGSGSLYLAAANEGAWAQPLDGGAKPERVSVSEAAEVAELRILRSYESGHTDADKIDELAAALGIAAEPVRMDSQAKYAILAAGKGELLLRLLSPSRPDYREKIWDHAAGALLVEEAGGRVTDLDGKPLDFTRGRSLAANRGIVASHGRLHDQILAALQKLGA